VPCDEQRERASRPRVRSGLLALGATARVRLAWAVTVGQWSESGAPQGAGMGSALGATQPELGLDGLAVSATRGRTFWLRVPLGCRSWPWVPRHRSFLAAGAPMPDWLGLGCHEGVVVGRGCHGVGEFSSWVPRGRNGWAFATGALRVVVCLRADVVRLRGGNASLCLVARPWVLVVARWVCLVVLHQVLVARRCVCLVVWLWGLVAGRCVLAVCLWMLKLH
jgi:hypothetical protein